MSPALIVTLAAAVVLTIAAAALLWPRRPKRRYIESGGIAVETDDPVAAEVISRAFRTGKAQYFSRDEDGNITRREIE